MNFFDGSVVRGDGGLVIDTGGFKLPVATEKEGELSPYIGKQLVLGIRPENIHAAQYTPAGIRAVTLEADVDVTESMGNELILYLLLDGKQLLARVDPRTDTRPGQNIQVAMDIDRLHTFDPETSEAIGMPAAEEKAERGIETETAAP
jgi:multiple sugar transport system ATP-binding protein